MTDTQQKVAIKLTDVGNRPKMVLAVLSKIQGLNAPPEQLIADAPCYISEKVPLSVAEEVKKYLERAGAAVEIEASEMVRETQHIFLASSDDTPVSASLSDIPGHTLTIPDEERDSTLYDASEPVSQESDMTFFSSDSLSDTAAEDESSDYDYSSSKTRFAETFNGEALSTPKPKRRRRKKRTPITSKMIMPAIVFFLVVLIAGSLWMYFSGKFSNLARQYEESPVVGLVGTLKIENEVGAELELYHVLGTRVFEPIPLEGTITNLRLGDYFVEARKNSQILRYPVYIKGRGHRLKVTVSFPDMEAIPDNMAYIPAGWFRMGNKETEVTHFGFPDEKPDVDVYVAAFLMSKYEVTNREYAEFIEAGGYEKKIYWESLIEDWDSLTKQVQEYEWVYGNEGWDSVNKYIRTRFIDTDDRPGPRLWEKDTPPYEYGQDDYPVIGITLYEAEAYCKWLSQQTGKVHRLPTEAEWEKAARGYAGYFFSYGNEYDPTRANTETEGPKKVGAYPSNGFEVYDLTGNVWEWVSDQYRADAYQYFYDQHEEEIRNPRVFNENKRYDRRVVRGGSFRSVNRINAKTTIRYPMFPNYWHTNIGFRYVTTP